MSVGKFVGTFLQSTLFGGTYEDVAFEVRVLKGEVSRLHDRLDAEMARLNARLDELAGAGGAGRGRGRLSVMSAAEAADAPSPKTPGGGLDAAPTEPPLPTTPTPASAAQTSLGLGTQGDDEGAARRRDAALAFARGTTIAAAFGQHPGARAVFAHHHLPSCLDCPLSESETVEQGAALHSLDIEALLRDLNQLTLH